MASSSQNWAEGPKYLIRKGATLLHIDLSRHWVKFLHRWHARFRFHLPGPKMFEYLKGQLRREQRLERTTSSWQKLGSNGKRLGWNLDPSYLSIKVLSQSFAQVAINRDIYWVSSTKLSFVLKIEPFYNHSFSYYQLTSTAARCAVWSAALLSNKSNFL